MIVVVADDLSGAAELAGAAWRHGLSAEVQRTFIGDSSAQVVCLDTDSRLSDPAQAAIRVDDACRKIKTAQPEWIFKKTDSVLRGPVFAELSAMLAQTGHERAVLIPANPGKLRIIRDGRYWINGVPLHETDFAHDPEFPRTTSLVRSLLGNEAGAALEAGTLIVPEAASGADLRRWAQRIDAAYLPAGGVEFFVAMLEQRGHSPSLSRSKPRDPRHGARTVFVCGSYAAWVQGRRRQCASRGIAIELMPPALFASDVDGQGAETEAWANRMRERLERRGSVMAAIGDSRSALPFPPQELTARLAGAVERLTARTRVDRIFLEGGATASAFLRCAAWDRLLAHSSSPANLAALHPFDRPDIEIFIKPGSYDWPDWAWPPRPVQR